MEARGLWAGFVAVCLAACALTLSSAAHATSVNCTAVNTGGAEAADVLVVGGAREHNFIVAGSMGLHDVRILDGGFRNRGTPIAFDFDCNDPPGFSFDTMNVSLGTRGDVLYLLNPKGMRQDGFTKLERHVNVRGDGGSGSDALLGHSGIDALRGEVGRDVIFGSRGADSVRGGPGIDVVVGGRGNDLLMGEAGRDLLLARDGEADRVRCGDGTDFYDADSFDSVAPTCEKTLADLLPLQKTPQGKLLQKLRAAK